MTWFQPRPARQLLLGSAVTVIWVAALVFYWSVDPGASPNRFYLAALVLSYLLIWGLISFWSAAATPEKATRFLLTSVSLALTVGLLECLALVKLVDFRLALGTPIWEPWKHPDNLLEPKLLHVHKPSYHTRFEGIDYRYDRHGLRNPREIDSADVVVIGDSFIEGWKVAAEDMLTTLLAKELGLTVANLGQSWYGPQQELELLRRYGVALHPKTCVWAFFEGNDLSEVHRYQEATRNWPEFSSKFHSFTERSFTKNAMLAESPLPGARGNATTGTGASGCRRDSSRSRTVERPDCSSSTTAVLSLRATPRPCNRYVWTWDRGPSFAGLSMPGFWSSSFPPSTGSTIPSPPSRTGHRIGSSATCPICSRRSCESCPRHGSWT
jgi:hypothetical protein